MEKLILYRRLRFLVFGLAGLALLSLLVLFKEEQAKPLPDFSQYQNIEKKKQDFFAYLRPRISAANTAIKEDRQQLDRLLEAFSKQQRLNFVERKILVELAAKYRLDVTQADDDQKVLQTLDPRVNTLPPALVLVQAAKESGWGTSKFARLGNNLFGQQCFVEGCGFVPSARAKGRSHEVEKFASVEAAIASYMSNLNTHRRYKEMRKIRSQLLHAQNPVTGVALADGLLAYSERGAAYVAEVKHMIRSNDLE